MKLNVLLITLFLILVIVLISSRLYFSEESHSTTNILWNGISQFSSFYKTNNLYDLSDLEVMDQDTALLIVYPTKNFTTDESLLIEAYMEQGGNVIVMDDYGTANTLLESITSPISIYQLPVCQYDSYHINPNFPIIKNFTSPGSIYRVNSLILNHPVSLNVSGDAIVLATTSRQGWIDTDFDGLIWTSEPFNAYPLMASATYGKGTLTVISDADIITNGMIIRGDNRMFIAALLKSNAVYIDMTHGHEVPPLARLLEIIRYDLAAQVVCLIIILMFGYVFYRRAGIIALLRPQPKDEEVYMDKKESIISYMKSKLPIKENELNEFEKKL
ncbi:MAG: GldG family protein [Dehalobacter sp.]|nr:GldG family protein [Dehalobacter sp.]